MLDGRARYGLICTEGGGIIDDGIIYRMGPERFMLIANAANAEKVLAWVTRWRDDRFNDVTLNDITQPVSMIALQGPKALEIAIGICDFDVTAVRTFRIAEGLVDGHEALVARTGYTGEDGFELMPPAEHAPGLWDALMQWGAVPCGLGARDTLRLEAGLLLHGSDMDEAVNPIEAGLDRFVKLDAGDFCGLDAIRAIAEKGPERRLAAFRMNERTAAPRPHSPMLAEGNVIGQVSSGGYGPTVDANIGLGYVPARFATSDSKLQIDVRGKLLDATVVTLPFYSRFR
jgi:aminomethyltransferase